MSKGGVRNLVRRGSLAIGIRFLSAGLGFGLIFVLSKWMSSSEFGRYGFAFSLATTVALVTDLGQKRLVLRSLAAYHERGRLDLMRAVLGFCLKATALGTFLACTIMLVVGAVIDLDVPVVPLTMLAVAMLLADFQSNLLRGLGSLVGSLVPREIVWRPAALGTMALIGGGISIAIGATEAIWILAVALLGLTAIQFLLFTLPRWRSALARAQSVQPGVQAESERVADAKASWIGASLRLWAVSAMNTGMLPLSVVIVGLFVSPVETGAFFAAIRIATLIAFPLQGLNLLTGPMLARAYAAQDESRLQKVASFTALWATAAALAGTLALSIFGERALSLLNDEFAIAATTLLIVMGGFLLAAMCGSSSQLMNMTGHDRDFLMILLIANPLGLAALVLLTYLYGLVGAATGLLVLKASSNIAVVYWARKNLGIDPSIAAYLSPPRKHAA